MATLLTRGRKIRRDGETTYYVEVYKQPLPRFLAAKAFHTFDMLVGPLAHRLDPLLDALTHRNGCPDMQPMTTRDGGQTEPMCVCLPFSAKLDYICYNLSRKQRVAVSQIEVTEDAYLAMYEDSRLVGFFTPIGYGG